LYKLQNDPEYSEIAALESDNKTQVELILAKKAEGRAVTPEEYQFITQFVDRVERGILYKYQAERDAEEEQIMAVKETIPAKAFDIPLEDFDVSDRVYAVISEGGYPTVGALILQMKLDSDKILGLHGMGPKGMIELEQAIENLTFPEEELEPEAVMEEVTETGLEVEAISIDSEEAATEITAIDYADTVDEKFDEKEIVGEPVDVPAPETLEAAVEPDQFKTPVELEQEESLEELFAIKPEVFDYDQEEDEELTKMDSSSKKKKKKKFVEIEYDPDSDATIVKRKRKRADQEWEEEW